MIEAIVVNISGKSAPDCSVGTNHRIQRIGSRKPARNEACQMDLNLNVASIKCIRLSEVESRFLEKNIDGNIVLEF